MNPAILPEILIPILALLTGLLIFYRSTIGLERHLRPLSYGFLSLGLSHILGLSHFLRNTTSVFTYHLVAPFGPIWLIEHLLQLIALVIFTVWAFRYLFKRLDTQIFIIFTTGITLLFLITTVTFTGLLFQRLQDQAQASIHTNATILLSSLDGKKSELLASLQVLSENPSLKAAIISKDRDRLIEYSRPILDIHKASSLIVASSSGVIYARAEDANLFGDSLPPDELFTEAISGTPASTYLVLPQTYNFDIAIKCITPVKSGQEVIGVIQMTYPLDNAFLDNLKKTTGLDSAIYTQNKISSTTITNPDQLTRPNGFPIPTQKIPDAGTYSISNQQFIGAFLPLVDQNNNIQGAFFVGSKESALFTLIGASIQTTLIGSLLIILLSLIPTYFIARHISSQR